MPFSEGGSSGWSKPYRDDRPVALMHVPKAAGTSLTSALGATLGLARSRFHLDLHHFGPIRRPEAMAADCRQSVCFAPEELRGEDTMVAGHISLSTLLEGRSDSQYITVFREPLVRIVSHWVFCRAVTDAHAEPWGHEWSAVMRQSRGSLLDFLLPETGIAQSDNLIVRMLLRPHPLIPESGAIDPRHDEVLLAEAHDRLNRFSFADVIENPAIEANMAAWFGRPFRMEKLNEAPRIPSTLARDLSLDLTEEGFALLEARSRLDRVLWSRIAGSRLPGVDIEAMRTRTISRYLVQAAKSLSDGGLIGS